MATKYSSGRSVEQKAINFLKELGYEVMRSAGSKGTFDIIAYNLGGVRFIQIKSGVDPEKATYKTDIAGIMSAVVPEVNATRELWVHKTGVGFVQVLTDDLIRPRASEFPKSVIDIRNFDDTHEYPSEPE
jgi:Holliday junction resolvase-like predicted endonuclease